MKIAIALILACAAPQICAQVETGTFVVIRSSQKEIVVAADSRAIVGGAIDDNSCKISALGDNLIFAAAGETGVTHKSRGLSWDSRTTARDLFLRLSRQRADEPMPIRLAIAWGNEVKTKLKIEATHNKAISKGKTPGMDLTSGVFAGFYENAPLIVVGGITYEVNSGGVFDPQFSIRSIYRTPQTVILGDTAIAAKLGAPATSRSQRWIRSLPFSPDPIARFAIGAVNFAIQYSPTRIGGNGRYVSDIAGPVDAVRLVRFAGPEWIQIKPKCPKD